MTMRMKSIPKSTTRSVMTVPISLLTGISSVELSAAQRTSSPDRGTNVFEKYPKATAQIAMNFDAV
jgi:hypothetical protein